MFNSPDDYPTDPSEYDVQDIDWDDPHEDELDRIIFGIEDEPDFYE